MKKTICVFVVFCLLMCALISCTGAKIDPIALAKDLAATEDYYIEVLVDADDIEDFADEAEVKSKGIYCIISAMNYDDDKKSGIFVYCESADDAKEVEKRLIDILEEELSDMIRGTVERSGELVFIGCEDVWENIN